MFDMSSRCAGSPSFFVLVCSSAGSTAEKSARAMSPMAMGNCRTMILTKDQVQGLLDPEFFHFRRLGDDHLFLFLRDVGLLEQQPSLDFAMDLNSMFLNFSKLPVMLSDV